MVVNRKLGYLGLSVQIFFCVSASSETCSFLIVIKGKSL